MKSRLAVLALSLCLAFAARLALAQAGSLDPAFGNEGIVVTDFGPLNNSFVTNDFSFSDAALAPSGDIVIAGSVSGLDGQSETAVIARYLASGENDLTFANDGLLTIPAPPNFVAGLSFPLSVSVQSDGKLLVLLLAANSTGTQPETIVFRFNVNGKLDTSFGGQGFVFVSFPQQALLSSSPNLVLAQPDGKILVAGSALAYTGASETLLARYLANGAPDATFGSNGVALSVSIDSPSALAILSGDRVLAANLIGQIAEFASNGKLEASSAGGTIVARKNTGNVTFTANGKLLIGAPTQGPSGRRNLDTKITRLLASGGLDFSFASPAISFGANGPSVKSEPSSVAVDSEGRGVVGGIFVTPAEGVFGVARVNSNGSIDTTFGSNGAVTTQIALEGSVFSVLVQSDNKILAIGEVQVSKTLPGTTEGLGIARYLAQ